METCGRLTPRSRHEYVVAHDVCFPQKIYCQLNAQHYRRIASASSYYPYNPNALPPRSPQHIQSPQNTRTARREAATPKLIRYLPAGRFVSAALHAHQPYHHTFMQGALFAAMIFLHLAMQGSFGPPSEAHCLAHCGSQPGGMATPETTGSGARPGSTCTRGGGRRTGSMEILDSRGGSGAAAGSTGGDTWEEMEGSAGTAKGGGDTWEEMEGRFRQV